MKKIIFYPTIFILIFLSSYILADKNDHGYTIEEQVKSYGKLEIVSSKAMGKDYPILVEILQPKL